MAAGRVLLIDDDPDIGALLKDVADRYGCEVFCTSDPSAFKDCYTANPPDTILLDLAMPGTDGIELLRYLADVGCKARLMIVSGFDRRVLESALRLGKAKGLNMAGTLAKPLRLADLKSVLRGDG
jgi:DNA-binding response OmpR family regulator